MRCSTTPTLLALLAVLPLVMPLQAQELESLRIQPTITANAGQWHEQVRYASVFRDQSVIFQRNGVEVVSTLPACRPLVLLHESPAPVLPETRAVQTLRFVDPSPRLQVLPGRPLGMRSHFYLGGNRDAGTVNVANYASVQYRNVWDGVSIEYAVHDSAVTQRVTMLPGADPSVIVFTCRADARLENVVRLRRGVHADAIGVRQEGGTVRLVTADSVVTDTTILDLEFGFFLGGSGSEFPLDITTDPEGSIYICGVSTSLDYPLLRAHQGTMRGGGDYVLTKLDCRGSVVYSTYYGGAGSEAFMRKGTLSLGYASIRRHIAATASGQLFLQGTTTSQDLALSRELLDDPARPLDSACFLARFDAIGQLDRAVLLLDATRAWVTHVACDSHGEPLMYGIARDSISFITQYTLQPRFPGPGATFLFKLSFDLSQLRWGTYWRPGTNYGSIGPCAVSPGQFSDNLHLDAQDNILLSGYLAQRYVTWPLFVTGDEEYDMGSCNSAVSKLNPEATVCMFTRYIGGASAGPEPTMIEHVTTDPQGNIIITGISSAQYLRYLPRATPPSGLDGFIVKLSPLGVFKRGGRLEATGTGMTALFSSGFAHGTIMAFGYTRPFTHELVHPREHPSGSHVGYRVYTWDAESLELRSVSPFLSIRHRDNPTAYPWMFSYWPDHPPHRFTTTGHLVLLGPLTIGPMQIDTLLGYHAFNHPNVGAKVKDPSLFVTRLQVARGAASSTQTQGPDSLVLHIDPLLPVSERFPFTATVTNTSPNILYDLSMSLGLPSSVVLDPGSQQHPRKAIPSTLAPGQSWAASFTLKADKAAIRDSVLVLRTFVHYSDDAYGRSCPPLTEWSESHVRIIRGSQSPPEILCDMQVLDSVALASDQLSYEPTIIPVTAIVRNGSSRPMHVAQTRLSVPRGDVQLVPRADSVRTIGMLAPGESRLLTWNIRVLASVYARSIPIRVNSYDSLGNMLGYCLRLVHAPATRGVRCEGTSDTLLQYAVLDGRYTPELFTLAAQIGNPMDSTRTLRLAAIDLSRAPHLQLDAGDSATRSDIMLPRLAAASLSWTVRGHVAPAQSTTDTVVFRYVVDPGGYVDSCLALVHITREEVTLACALRAPDTLALDASGTQYTGMPGTLSARVSNSDARASSALTLTLEVDPTDGLTVLDPLVRPLAAIAARGSDSVRWRWTAPALRHARTVRLLARVRDTAGVQQSSCEHVLFIPGITGDLTCTLTAPDSIAYDVAGDVHVPDPFTVQVALENRLDTLRPLVETEIDLTHAPHLALAAGESARRTLTDIPARGQVSADYRLTVRTPLTSPVRDTVRVRTRAVGDSTWQACAHPVFIDGRERIVSVSCATRGQDTLWGDPYYETVIPLPLQVEYALTNTGNAPLRSCAVAILPPPMYVLAGSDSVQQYGEIAPGATVRRDWLLTLDPAQAVPGTSAIAFVPQCAELSAPPVCTRPVTLAVGAPEGIVLTPWRLHFAAEQGGALPAAQQVTLWTGNGASIFWQAVPDAGWLRAEPGLGSVKTVMDVQPTTTALAAGMHEGTVTVSAGRYVRPHRIEATYTLTTIVSTAELPIPQSVELGPAYPNPATGEVRIDILLDAPRAVLLELYDLYGRRVAQLHEGPLSAGRHTIRWSAAGLPSGLYLHVLRTDRGTLTRSVVVRR
jgi:hypothetical protein